MYIYIICIYVYIYIYTHILVHFPARHVADAGNISTGSPSLRLPEATRGLNLSEDIFAGLDLSLRGGWTAYREYFHVGKARAPKESRGMQRHRTQPKQPFKTSLSWRKRVQPAGQRHGLHECAILLCQSLNGKC